MPRGYCKVRNCDQFGNKDHQLVYQLPQLPSFRADRHLTPCQEIRLKRRKAWLKALGFKEDDSSPEINGLVVCPKHFVSGKPASIRDVNSVDWVPTLQLGQDDVSVSESSDVVDLTLDSEDEYVDDDVKAVKRKMPRGTFMTSKLPKNCVQDNSVTQKLLKDSVQNDAVKKMLPRLTPSPHIFMIKGGRADVEHTQGQHAGVSLKGGEEPSVVIKSDEQSLSTDDLDEKNMKDLIKRLKNENRRLLSQNLKLKAKIVETETMYKSLQTDHITSMCKFSDLRYIVDRHTISEKTFVADEEVVRYFTGLPTFDVLKAMFVHIEPYMDTSHYPITKFQQYILTLMCIRLNIGFDLLCYVFRLPVQSVSKIFSRVLQVMYGRYEPLVSWPSRENLFPSVPLLFRETFGQQIVVIVDTLVLAVVIDSIELMMDGPSEIDTVTSTLKSDYRNQTYVKFLIGLSPQGAVTFISKSSAGNVSEKELIETSGLMQNLLIGDIILGEKGCSVHQIVEGKPGNIQLQPYKLKKDQNISNLKSHVKRTIDIFEKTFKFWSSGLPVEFFNVPNDGPALIDKMIQASCALNNASLTVVL